MADPADGWPEGAVRFDRWMEERLYGAEGFYTAAGAAGRAEGDFITSPEVGPLFGAVIASWLDRRWDELDRPDPFPVLEAGAGRGALAAAVLRAGPRCAAALRYVTVERSERLRGRQRELLGDRVEVRDELPDHLGTAVVVANELLDNLPFRILERAERGWREIAVQDRHLVPVALHERPPSEILDDVEPGTRLPWCTGAVEWVGAVLERLDRGHVLCIDYGVRTTAELAGRSWLRTYVRHGRGVDPVAPDEPTDVTADVAFDQLPGPVLVETQAEFLRREGIEELVEEGRRIWEAGAARGDLAAMVGRSRIVEAEALVDPSGLGAFLAAHWEV